jgi:DNA-binding PadR family transcriptional regulator
MRTARLRHHEGVGRESEGRVILRPGTLYRVLSRLEAMGFVEEFEMRAVPKLDDERRRYYGLTGLGKRLLKAKAQRLAHQVDAARPKKLIQGRPDEVRPEETNVA